MHVIRPIRDRAPITWQIGVRRTNYDQEFFLDMINKWNTSAHRLLVTKCAYQNSLCINFGLSR